MKRISSSLWHKRAASAAALALFSTLGTVGAVGTMGAAALLAGCDQQQPQPQPRAPSFQNLDLSGNTEIAQNFSLPDTNGVTRTLADYKGKVVVLVFGYTHCPDVCPTTLSQLAQALQELGPQAAKRVQVLFISVDPQRDTNSVLAQYTSAFNPSFVALRPASDAQLKQVTKSFRIQFQKVPSNTPDAPDSYSVDHTAASYVFDANGKPRLYVRDAQGVTPWVHDLKLLLD